MVNKAKIIIEGLSKYYLHGRGKSQGQTKVLNEVNLTIRSDEFVSIVGPTGCGKTTLLKIVAGLLKADEGQIRIVPSSDSEREIDFGMVFQTSALLPWLRVRDNIFPPFLRKMHQYKRAKETDRLEYLLELSGLRDFELAYPHQLSVGMRQKVALCRALIGQPGLLLLDEPFNSLDPITRERLNLELSNIWIQEPTTAILVSHSVDEAVFLSDRVVVLSERPASVKGAVEITLSRPRSEATWETPEFHTFRRSVRWLLENK